MSSVRTLILSLLPYAFGLQEGLTPLHLCAMYGSLDLAADLLRYKANVVARSDTDTTCMHIAATNDHGNFLRLLLDHEAEINAEDMVSVSNGSMSLSTL